MKSSLCFLSLLLSLTSFAFSQTPTPTDTTTDTIAVSKDFETDADFKGGYKKLAKYVSKNLKWGAIYEWPAAQKLPFEDKVIVRFVVEKDGTLSHIHVESATQYCPPCNKEAMRLAQQMPKWKPATKNGELVRIWVRVPINFQLF
jgi:periplasmic protein TonB